MPSPSCACDQSHGSHQKTQTARHQRPKMPRRMFSGELPCPAGSAGAGLSPARLGGSFMPVMPGMALATDFTRTLTAHTGSHGAFGSAGLTP